MQLEVLAFDLIWQAFHVFAEVVDNLATELLPVFVEDDLGSFQLLSREAGVFEAPLSELLPSVDVHSQIAYHDLVEFVRQRICVKSWSSVSHISKGSARWYAIDLPV